MTLNFFFCDQRESGWIYFGSWLQRVCFMVSLNLETLGHCQLKVKLICDTAELLNLKAARK